MRVLLLSNMHPSPRFPAYGTFVQAHIEALRRRTEIDVTPVVITDPRKGWRTPLKYASFAARAWSRGFLRRFEIVHVHYAHPTAIGAVTAAWRGARVVITAHGGDVNEMLLGRAPAAARRSFLRADHIIAVSRDLQRKLRETLGGACPPVSVCNMGVDTERFTPASHPISSPARLLFVGQLIERKGVGTLLRAAARLRREWQLEIVGTGSQRAAFERLVADLALGERVRFLGALPAAALPTIYRTADLFVGPSHMEALGLVFLEAAASGCPVVATRVGGIPEILTDGESALLVPPGEPEALAQAMETLLSDADLRTRLIRGGLSAASRSSQATSIAHTVEVYHQVRGI